MRSQLRADWPGTLTTPDNNKHGTRMKIFLVHNRYQQSGGEDIVFEFEGSLLERAGHEVRRLVVSNDDIKTAYEKIRTAWSLPWNSSGFRLVADAIARNRPDIMHVHNIFPLLSPSIYDAAAAANVAVVQTLHNFRITCANGMLLRDGAPCELCITGTPYNAVRFRCYRNSYFGSFAVARMIAVQRRQKESPTKVARFVALSEFARSRFVFSGLPAEKITVKPNGAIDSTIRSDGTGRAILFVGRLSREKGVDTLINAARFTTHPVRIVGDGPLRKKLEADAPPNVTFLGRLSHDRVIYEMSRSRCLVLPSAWYEGFPLVLVEAYSVGLPVVASRLGSLIELVEDGVTGLHFAPNDVIGLARAVERLTSDAAFAVRLGHASRRRYEDRFTPERVLSDLETIYRSVMAEFIYSRS
jgi:glycosyltransferase involved in cell wall biosynthesis